MKSDRIADNATREAVRALELIAERLKSIKQLPIDATNEQIINAINKITDSIKR